MSTEPIHVISLGAGVQSSTMALMATEGELTPMPAFGVFADTGDEPKEVYEWLGKLRGLLPFKVEIAHRDPLHSKLSENIFEWNHSQIPAFVYNEDGDKVPGKRQCTKHWKIIPIQRKIREVTNTQCKRLPNGFVTLWQGISIDEVSRAKDSREPWITHRFPLLEKRMSRHDCELWLKARGLKAPKSACKFCPLRSNSQWAKSKDISEDWQLIVSLDRQLNQRGEYLHPSCQPIDQVKLTDKENGQLNLFENECEGFCNV